MFLSLSLYHCWRSFVLVWCAVLYIEFDARQCSSHLLLLVVYMCASVRSFVYAHRQLPVVKLKFTFVLHSLLQPASQSVTIRSYTFPVPCTRYKVILNCFRMIFHWAERTVYNMLCIFKHFVWHCDWYGILCTLKCIYVFVCRSKNLTVPNSTLSYQFIVRLHSVYNGAKQILQIKTHTFYLLNLLSTFIFIHIWGGKLTSRTSACNRFW